MKLKSISIEVAFSGAEEFLDKYKDSAKDSGIIGHFGLRDFTQHLWLLKK